MKQTTIDVVNRTLTFKRGRLEAIRENILQHREDIERFSSQEIELRREIFELEADLRIAENDGS